MGALCTKEANVYSRKYIYWIVIIACPCNRISQHFCALHTPPHLFVTQDQNLTDFSMLLIQPTCVTLLGLFALRI